MSVGGGFQPSAPTPSQPPQSQPQVGGDMMRHTGMGFSDTGMMTGMMSNRPDMSMGFARNFQQPSFFNPFFGSYGAPPQYGMGGFGGGFGGGFNPMMGGIGGFGGYGGFGGMGGGFNPMMGGFGGGFNPMRTGIGSLGGFQNQFGNAYAAQILPQPMPDFAPITRPMLDNPSSNMTGFRKTSDGKWERDPNYLADIMPLSAAGQEPQAATGVAVGPQRTFSGPNALIDGMNAMEQDRIAREGQRGKYGWHNGLWSA